MAWASVEEALTMGTGIERAFVCPVHGSNNAHASVNSMTGWWFCYSCHARGHVDMDTIQLDPYNVKRNIEKVMARLNPSRNSYPETYLNLFDSMGPGAYWLSRFSEETCTHFRLGQDPAGSYATTPMRGNTGTVLGVIRRDLTGLDKAKYRYPDGLDVSTYLFDYHRKSAPTIILTEGATDAIACHEAGHDVAMALYGSNFSRAQQALLRKYDPCKIIVATDQDASGESAYKRIKDAMGRFCPVVRLEWDTYKDLASIPVDERQEMLTEALRPTRRVRIARRG